MLSFYWVLACLFAGFLTFLSPCILPVLPIVLSTAVGTSRWRPFWIVLGLILSFTILGLVLSFLGSFFGISPQVIRWIALGFLFLAGLLFLFPSLSDKIFHPLTQKFSKVGDSRESVGSYLLLGASLGAIWTPCAGPIFAAVLSGALLQRSLLDSTILLFAYALGAGVPMLLVGYLGGSLMRRIRGIAKKENQFRRFTGALLILASILFAFGLDTRLIASVPVSWLNLSKVEQGIVEKIDGSEMKTSASTPMLLGTQMPTSGGQKNRSDLPVLGSMPEIDGIARWINSSPLQKKDLKGKVVLIDFWTYSCINCLRTLPYVKSWYNTYKDQGFVVVGIHTPEFAFEKDYQNVVKAVKDLNITYPVGQDNDFTTWRNFNNRYWPAHYLIDAEGNIRYTHFGEGEYDRTEKAIQSLLKEKGKVVQGLASDKVEAKVDFSRVKSLETYLGYGRMENFNSPEPVKKDSEQLYTPAAAQKLNTWSLDGEWKIELERVINFKPQAKLRFKFEAQRLNLVMSSASGQPIRAQVKIDGKKVGSGTAGKDATGGDVLIQAPRLYELLDIGELKGEHLFEIEFLDPMVAVFAFTFG